MLNEDRTASLPPFRQALLAAPLSPVQKLAIAMIVAMCALDGVDVFSITFAAPAIERELLLGKAQLGLVFSSALAGMALGSLFLSPLADAYGRRALLIGSLCLMVIGTLWTSVAGGFGDLALSRLVTGLGIGTMVAVNNPLAAEYANARTRDFSVALLNLGYPAGAMAGGLLAAWMLPAFGWRALFMVAAAMGFVMLVLVLVWLPEPIVGILARRGPATLDRLNAFLRRCGQPEIASLPPATPASRGSALGLVLGRSAWRYTLRITAIYFLFMLSIFYIQLWIPSMVVTAGYSPSKAALASTLMSLSGVVGGTILSALVPRLGLKTIVTTGIALTAVAIMLFGVVAPRFEILAAISVLVGVGTIGGMANLYAILSRSFPGEARASGTGFVIGIGRIGSALGPAFAGLLFSLGYGRMGVSLVLALPALAAALILALGRQRDFA